MFTLAGLVLAGLVFAVRILRPPCYNQSLHHLISATIASRLRLRRVHRIFIFVACFLSLWPASSLSTEVHRLSRFVASSSSHLCTFEGLLNLEGDTVVHASGVLKDVLKHHLGPRV
ncbi:hypothetical protein PIB30_016598 [Stylosanthes scabra]|uniref:Secreted protein n=1 Tax=Stylosanthes scabra TaxID=79078 RepID=A0ABU6T943_9FABA|nr:hypothetical protein [Stylosanthes scabra]